MNVAFAVPSLQGPTAPFVSSLEKSLPLVNGAGWRDICVEERGCPYISSARATLLRKALTAGADVVVFLDYDLSWDPGDLLRLIETPGDVVAGTYRFKTDEESYMGTLFSDEDGLPIAREDGCLKAELIPAGFLKITTETVHKLMGAYPELVFGPRHNPSLDLFNHGAHEGIWWGEDYAFSRRWRECGGDIWIIPDLNITHHTADTPYPGNFHDYLMRQPGGAREGRPPIWEMRDEAA